MGVYIPERLKIFVQEKANIPRTVSGQQQMILVKKAFATDADKPKTHETAERWAKNTGQRYDSATGKWIKNPDGYTVVDCDNKPFTGLKIYNIEVRSEGGRAYKVQTKEGWGFDCREDVILDTIMAKDGGIRPGGYMSGQYIWVKNESQMKITRVGSALYQEALRYQEVRRLPKLKMKDLVRGGVYKNARGDVVIYLGKARDPVSNKLKMRFCSICTYPSPSEDEFVEVWKKGQREDIKNYLKGKEEYYNKEEARWKSGYPRFDPRNVWDSYQGSHSFIKKLGQLTEEEITELVKE